MARKVLLQRCKNVIYTFSNDALVRKTTVAVGTGMN